MLTYEFLDSGSNTSFCTDTLLRKLDAKGVKTTLSLTTMQTTNEAIECSLVSDPNGDLDPDVNNQNYDRSANYCNYETAEDLNEVIGSNNLISFSLFQCLPTWPTEILPFFGEEVLQLWPLVENERRRWAMAHTTSPNDLVIITATRRSYWQNRDKSVVTWETCTSIAESNACGLRKQPFCLFWWSCPVLFNRTCYHRIASTSHRNYKCSSS